MNIKLVASFLMAVFVLAVWHRVCRWMLTRLRHRPPSLVASHLTSLVSFLILYALFGAEGPFVGCSTRLMSCPGFLAVPAQAICFASDWMAQRHKNAAQGLEV